MIKSELVQRSPIRIFEQSINGGLKAGEIGVIASPNGVGKTSVLVQIALDKLLQEKKVIHVSFTQHIHYVPVWYEDIFNEITSKAPSLENAAEIKNEIIKNRVTMNFNQDGVTVNQIVRSLRAMIIDGGFKADSIIIDGFDFSRTDRESIASVKTFAVEMGVCIWYSCSVKEDGKQYDKGNIPVILSGFADLLDVVIILEPKSEPAHVKLSISKDRDSVLSRPMAMKLDPKTLLILGV